MRKHWIRILAALVCAVALGLPSAASAVNGHVALAYAHKEADSDDWKPADSQTGWGALTATAWEGWPLHIAADVFETEDEGDFEVPFVGPAHREGSSREIALGIRKFWGGNRAIGYAGTGLAMINVESVYTDASGSRRAEEDAAGPWLGGGVLWRFGKRFEVGVDLRWSNASADLDYGNGVKDSAVEVGGFHAGLMFGLGWGS